MRTGLCQVIRMVAVICVLGDLLLDVVVRLDGPIVEDADAYGTTLVGPGGQAANVAAWTVALGGRARLVGKGADDLAGRLVRADLERRGVQVVGPRVESGTGTVVSIATPDGRRTMLSDRGVSPDFAPDELDPAWLDGCAWLFISGYSLACSPLRMTALAAAELGARVCVDLSSTTAIRQAGVEHFREALAELRPEVVFANEEESALVGKLEFETVVKRGAAGCLAGGSAYRAEPTNVVDGTGAGDAFAAGYLLEGPRLGLAAAARCLAKIGSMP
jgi:sugar/nucleoside kinase (ribokinase family)